VTAAEPTSQLGLGTPTVGLADVSSRSARSGPVSQIRRSGKMMGLGFDALVLTTIGRKTGAERTTPVGRFPDKHGSWLIVASAAGAPRHLAWHYNLAAHPDKVQIEMAGRKIALTAEQLHGVEREEAWQQITAAYPASRSTNRTPTASCRSSA
jgi:deazaflavin-dependent oxidoreductase (nitroreductase family)